MSRLEIRQKLIENETNFLSYINPLFNNILNDIINSRITHNMQKKNVKINYPTKDDDLFDLTGKLYKNQISNINHKFEINIYLFFIRENINFIVEHWKLKINSSQSQYSDLKAKDSQVLKSRIQKKLLTFFRTIKSLEKNLPLNSLLKKSNFDFEIKLELYQESNLEILSKEELETKKYKKMEINLESKDNKFCTIQLNINYLLIKDIIEKESFLRKSTNYNDTLNIISRVSTQKNSNFIEETEFNESQNYEEEDENDLAISEIITKSKINIPSKVKITNKIDIQPYNIIDNHLVLGNYKIDIKDLKLTDVEETINNQNIMREEFNRLNEIKNKYNINFKTNKILNKELFVENEGKYVSDVLIWHPQLKLTDKLDKNNNVIDDNKEKAKEKISLKNNKKYNHELIQDIINDYIRVKLLLTNKYK